jgi:hypothetical protein
MKIYGKITYTCDSEHPDIQYMNDWNENKVYTFEDTYTIKEENFYGDDDIMSYIKNDLRLVAGGGYNSKHIHNVEFEIRKI